MRKNEQYTEMIARLFPGEPGSARTVTFQVTDACCLSCTYCYQINKGTHSMPFDVAKRFIDMLLSADENSCEYINPTNTNGVIIEFIGGEPLLEVPLIDQITDYFMSEMIRLHHPWATRYRISICSNGVHYFDPEWQAFMKKHWNHLSFSISIDGCKELHDACRVFPDGSGSYDIAMAGVRHFVDVLGGRMGSKMTLAPENIKWTYKAVKSLIENGYDDINLNCVYEEGWTVEHAKILYDELVKVADYLIQNELYDKVMLSIFQPQFFRPKDPADLQTWCFKAGTSVFTPNGNKNIEDIKVGDIVYTSRNETHPVIATMSHVADNSAVLKICGALPIHTTWDHKFFAKRKMYRTFSNGTHYSLPKMTPLKDLEPNDLVALYVPDFGTENIAPEIAYLVGRYIGDGWESRGSRYICCSYEEREELEEHFKKAGVRYSVSKHRTDVEFLIARSNVLLWDMLSECGSSAAEKRLPKAVWALNEESCRNILRGYLDADGAEKKGRLVCNTVSETLAKELLIFGRMLGYSTSIYKNNRAGEQVIEGRTVNVRDRYELCFSTLGEHRNDAVKKDDGLNVIWVPIRSIEDDASDFVYNITVEENHSYVAEGVVVSNCGGTGDMIACDYKGDIYPCIRYMESSLGNDIKPLIIGNVYDGIMVTNEQCECVHCLWAVDRRTQSTDECFNCPIAEGCSYCSAYNYQVFGTPDSRATYICVMHQARALANAYFWNLAFRVNHENKRMKLYIPKEWALKIISEEEWNLLKALEN